MIDVHAHIFNFKYVPDGYFQKFSVRREGVGKVSVFLDTFLPWTDRDRLSSYARFLRTGSSESMKEILDAMVRYYPPNTIFTPLMMDLCLGISGCRDRKKCMGDGAADRPWSLEGQDRQQCFAMQMREMIGIKKRHRKTVYPFLAVDPRRTGILDLVKRSVGRNRDFHGIKIYPALGYLPSHPALMKVFDYCSRMEIPVTAHCSRGGVNSDFFSIPVKGKVFDGERYVDVEETKRQLFRSRWRRYFNEPRNWVPVLEKYKNLRLNLAHFGGEDEWRLYLSGRKGTWVDKVINLAMRYENVYTDISYTFCHREFYPTIRKMIMGPMGEKMLFGSDYYMAEMEGHFYSSINTIFVELTEEERRKITEINPKKFLNW